jgi:exosortase/archaeosortase family protein
MGLLMALLMGLLMGLPFVCVINQVRVLVLFHTYRFDRVWLEWVHGLLGPLVLVALVALVLAFFLFWLDRFAATPLQTNTS